MFASEVVPDSVLCLKASKNGLLGFSWWFLGAGGGCCWRYLMNSRLGRDCLSGQSLGYPQVLQVHMSFLVFKLFLFLKAEKKESPYRVRFF